MADILFVTWDGGGAVPPALGIAGELRARGHRVRFLGHPVQAEALRAQGYDVEQNRQVRPFSGSRANSPLALMAAFGDRGMGRDLMTAVSARPANLVVVDCFMFGALAAARDAGLPFVVLEHTFDDYYERTCLRGPLGVSLRLRRLAPRRSLAAARARLVTSIPELDPARAGADLTYVGPVVDTAPPAAEGPTVLVSLSTFGYPGMQPVLQNVVDATQGLGARVVVTTGPLIDPQSLTRPPGVEVHRFVPHVELMPSATLMVGHGGHGTTMQALAHDLPVLVLPMSRITDQPTIGAAVARAGAGRVAPRSASVAELRSHVAALLQDGPHRKAAARLGTLIRALPGATTGADRIERVLRDAAPAPGRPGARP